MTTIGGRHGPQVTKKREFEFPFAFNYWFILILNNGLIGYRFLRWYPSERRPVKSNPVSQRATRTQTKTTVPVLMVNDGVPKCLQYCSDYLLYW
jgi:hypothetical protein